MRAKQTVAKSVGGPAKLTQPSSCRGQRSAHLDNGERRDVEDEHQDVDAPPDCSPIVLDVTPNGPFVLLVEREDESGGSDLMLLVFCRNRRRCLVGVRERHEKCLVGVRRRGREVCARDKRRRRERERRMKRRRGSSVPPRGDYVHSASTIVVEKDGKADSRGVEREQGLSSPTTTGRRRRVPEALISLQGSCIACTRTRVSESKACTSFHLSFLLGRSTVRPVTLRTACRGVDTEFVKFRTAPANCAIEG